MKISITNAAPGLALVLFVRAALGSSWTSALQASSSGPSSLEAYCAQVDPSDKNWNAKSRYVVGQPIVADWLEFGVWYDAHVTGINPDGTYNVMFDDDQISERRVKPRAMKPRKTGPQNFNPQNDPACTMKNAVDDLNEDINKAAEEVARLMSERRKKKAARSKAEQPAIKPMAEDEGAASAKPKKAAAVRGSSAKHTSSTGDSASAAPAPSKAAATATAGARSAAASPSAPVAHGHHHRQRHHHKKAGNGDSGLGVIIDNVYAVDDELEVIKAKEVKLEKAHKMDPELESAVEGAVAWQDKVKQEVNALQEAMADEKEAQKQLRMVEDDTAESGPNSDRHPRAHKIQKTKENAEAAVAAADAMVEKRIEGLQLGLRQVKYRAQKFDTSVTPNNEKWWRYRYEYSYVEAGILLCIVPIMVFYKFIYKKLRQYQSELSLYAGFASLIREIETMHLAWLQFAAGEMVVCFCVVLTIWLLATFGCLDFLVVHIKDDNIHLPTEPEHYRIMAVNISMQLGLSLIVYHGLVYSIVRASVVKFSKWNAYEGKETSSRPIPRIHLPRDSAHATESASQALQAIRSGPTLMGSQYEFRQMRIYFIDAMEKYPHIKEKLEEIEELSSSFPFSEYLCVNVRLYTEHVLELTWGFWALAWFTFIVFMVLHRFAHMAYVRIMSFFAVFLVVVLLGMWLACLNIDQRMTEWHNKDETEQEEEFKRSEAFQRMIIFSQEQWMSHLLQFSLFFLCYGFVRMVTAPWLWHIYFYNVLVLTCVFLLVMLFFVFYLAPLIPVFYAAMSIPPNISETDAEVIVKAMKHRHELQVSPMKATALSHW